MKLYVIKNAEGQYLALNLDFVDNLSEAFVYTEEMWERELRSGDIILRDGEHKIEVSLREVDGPAHEGFGFCGEEDELC